MRSRPSIFLAVLAACGGASSTTTTTTKPSDPTRPVAQATGHARADLIPRAILFGNPERANVQISPDGKYVSWTAPKDGVMNVWIAPFDKLDDAKAVTAEAARPIRTYFWAYSSKHLIYQQDAGGDENFHWYRITVADGSVTDLTPFKDARANYVAMSPAQPNRLMLMINDRDPEAMDLCEIDLVTGKKTTVVENKDGFVSFTVGHKLEPRFATKKPADGSVQVFARKTVENQPGWVPFDTFPLEDAETSELIALTPTSQSVYAIESRGRDTAALVSIEVSSKKQKLLAEDAKADANDIVIHPTKHHVQAVVFEHARRRWQVLDASIKKDVEALSVLDGGSFQVGERTLDDKKWIVSTSTDQHGVRFYLWDRTKQLATLLFAAQPALEQQPLVKMWPVEIAARDGLSLVSYLSLPKAADPDEDGKADKPVPMVLLVHGGPWSRDRWGYSSLTQQLANRGYAVLRVNYRGSTGFGKKFLNAANLQWGKAMHDDLLDAVAWAVQAGIAPKDKVCIMGGSYGGYATLVGLTMTPDVFACGVDVVGPSNLETFMAAIPPYWAAQRQIFYNRVGNPETPEGKAILVAASPLWKADKIKRPLLVGQGANDPRVKLAESERIVAAMKQRQLPVTYAVFPDEGHGFQRPPNMIAFGALMEAFLSAHLGGDYQPLTADELAATTMEIKDGREGIPGLPAR